MAPHSSTLAWKIPWTEEPGWLQSLGVTKSWTRLSDFTFTFHFPALPGRFLATGASGKSKNCGLKSVLRTSLVVQWFEIHLPMQETPV